MNAKEFLSQAFHIEKQIQSGLERLEALKSLACRVTAAYDSAKVTCTRNTSALPDAVIRIMEAEEELDRRIDELVDRKLEIAEVIGRVEDVNLRLLLEKRYLSFKSWEQIAEDLNYSLRWLQEMHKDALEAVEEILGERES